MAYIDSVKGWFKTGLEPTQIQFYRLFEWLRWKDEKIPMADVQNLNSVLIQKADKQAFENSFRG